ncbi:hypothetical protein Pfo_026926 [Paulownia fortunei]|nr:hypothetical protein Pfo_026926 [Paulownia fortunei]
MKKQSAERDDGSNSMDRISQLPEAILQHILYFLSQKEAAQTCVLSKAWLHRWSTRPNFEFREKCFNGTKQSFLSLVNKTLQGYHDQKLCIQEFLIGMSTADSESVSLLEKWIPIVILNMGVKTFSLYFDSRSWAYFDLPSVVFEAESLQDLYLKRCKFNQKAPDKVLFNHLKTLSLTYVYIAEKTFQKIISSCPLIEFVALHSCEGLRTIKVNKLHNLKNFDFSNYEKYREEDSSIEFDVPTLETIRIVGSANWFHHHNYFPRLKSLYLSRVRLSNNSFDNLSCDFPSLEDSFISLVKLIINKSFILVLFFYLYINLGEVLNEHIFLAASS